MDDLLDDLDRIAAACERASKTFEIDPLDEIYERLVEACASLEAAWSGSSAGDHATVYTGDLKRPSPEEPFEPAPGGVLRPASRMTGNWSEYSYDDIERDILLRAGVADPEVVNQAARAIRDAFDENRRELLPLLESAIEAHSDENLTLLQGRLRRLKNHDPRSEFLRVLAPETMAVDRAALLEGRQVPHHVVFKCWLMEQRSAGAKIGELGDIARDAAADLRAQLGPAGN